MCYLFVSRVGQFKQIRGIVNFRRILEKMITKALTPCETGKFVVEKAKHVKVQPIGIEKLKREIIAGLQSKQISASNFSQHELHPKPDDAHAVNWIFLVDTLNFCFWTPTNYTKYKVGGYTGYFALCAAINRAIKEGADFTNPCYYANIDAATLKHALRSDDGQTVVPLVEERVECLQQVGARLLERWNGKFENVVRAAEGSAMELLQLIVNEFPCFRDEADYDGQRVALYKRAQILIGDLWACFQGKGLGSFRDLDCITMFADYRVPQVLVHFGCLEYSPELLVLLKRDEILKNGDPMEVEIRAASIYVVEKVKDAVFAELAESGEQISSENLNSVLIDHFLWDYRRQHAEELDHIPFHKVLSIYY